MQVAITVWAFLLTAFVSEWLWADVCLWCASAWHHHKCTIFYQAKMQLKTSFIYWDRTLHASPVWKYQPWHLVVFLRENTGDYHEKMAPKPKLGSLLPCFFSAPQWRASPREPWMLHPALLRRLWISSRYSMQTSLSSVHQPHAAHRTPGWHFHAHAVSCGICREVITRVQGSAARSPFQQSSGMVSFLHTHNTSWPGQETCVSAAT